LDPIEDFSDSYDSDETTTVNPLVFFSSNANVSKSLPNIIACLDKNQANQLKMEIMNAKSELEIQKAEFEREKADLEFRLKEFEAKENQLMKKQKQLEKEQDELGCKICLDTTFKTIWIFHIVIKMF
jgi:hypothetical protein